MEYLKITTLAALKNSGWKSKSIKEELRDNLIKYKKEKKDIFTDIHGYEETVIPDLERAILSKHDINFLGLRGQAKTKIARELVELLDEYIPIVKGSVLNEDPFKPITHYAKDLIKKERESTPITWLHRSERFTEKLATPDVTVPDLIGDIDPIKAANLKLSFSDFQVINYGLIPRSNRCIFVINEIPDLQPRIQVSLFNILQENDIQIRGFNFRMPLDIHFVFTANPEDYTNRGNIVTPLKDRIGSQILTHYPHNRVIAKKITEQESRKAVEKTNKIHVPELALDILEQIGFEARKSDYIDAKSGVSARMSITSFENLVSAAERRAIINNDNETCVRLTDFSGVISSINGKVELVYEGEQEGAEQISYYLISQAIKSIFPELFPKIEKLEKPDSKGPYDNLLAWFFNDNQLYIDDCFNDEEYQKTLGSIKTLNEIVEKYQPNVDEKDRFFMMEFLLWGLEANKKLSKLRSLEGFEFKDSLGSYIGRL